LRGSCRTRGTTRSFQLDPGDAQLAAQVLDPFGRDDLQHRRQGDVRTRRPVWTELIAEPDGARHSSETAMRAAGVPDDLVAAWHGHDENVMRRTYSHPDAVRLASAGQALADVFEAEPATRVSNR
jgi:hypothetical protein